MMYIILFYYKFTKYGVQTDDGSNDDAIIIHIWTESRQTLIERTVTRRL